MKPARYISKTNFMLNININKEKNDTERRLVYWSEQMEMAYGFMNSIIKYPVEECGESLMFLPEAIKDEGLSVQFSHTKLAGKHERLFYLRKGLVKDFIALSREMNNLDWTLRVEDGFRSKVMQKDLSLQENIFDNILQKVLWETKVKIPDPNLILRRLTVLVATCPKIGTHMSGSAIDISVLKTHDLSEVNRSGPYLELSELTPMYSPFASDDAISNRTKISEIMYRHGFIAYPYEFWHYSKGDAYAELLTDSGKPARYGPVDFDPSSGTITPISKTKEMFYSPEDIKKNIKLSLMRLNTKN